MINKTKIGDCSNENCSKKNTNCIKVGRNLYCISCRQRQKALIQIEKAKLKPTSRKVMPKKIYRITESNNDRLAIIQDLDFAISQLVRRKYADSYGIIDCFTCNWRGDWKSADCGHYISRSHMGLRWDLRNLRPQCKKCNQMMHGNINEFTKNLEKECPESTIILFEESKQLVKLSLSDLKELLISIRAKLKLMDHKFVK